MQLLAELKRRNVIRVAALYLVAAWLVVQVAGTVLPMFEVPDWVARAIVIVLAIGFVPALMAAWVFELTPEGIRRDGDVARPDAAAPDRGRRMDRMILVALLAIVVLMAGERAWNRDTAAPALATSTAGVDTKPAAAAGNLGIGVLPFDNLSPDADNAFFASGIHEEVLTRLASLDQVRVISRTSMETIAAENLAVPEIGRRLGVSHVLEGSVRRAGNQVRITVQLIEAATDKHLWAQNYDRTLDDVFAIQSEIALAIADQLKLALSPVDQTALQERPTLNAEAYDLYLRAKAEQRLWRGAEGFRALIALLEPAVALDPDFQQARGDLANAYGRMYWLGEDPDGSYLAKARAQVDELAKRSPGSFQARLAQAQLVYNVERDYATALPLLQALATERPNDADVALLAGSALKRLGRHAEQLEAMTRALSLDPESPLVWGEMTQALGSNGHYADALTHYAELFRRHPENPVVAANLAAFQLRYGGDRGPLLKPEFADTIPALRAAALFSEGDVDGAVAEAGMGLDDLQAPVAARRLAFQAELLRLAGRDAEARPIAQRALARMRAWIDANPPSLGRSRAMRYLTAATTAAIAEDRALAQKWLEQAQAEPALYADEVNEWTRQLALFHVWQGDAEAGWAQLQTLAEGPELPHPALRALRPFYDAMFGEVPAYRAFLAKVEAEQ